jgi:hypothetical protein
MDNRIPTALGIIVTGAVLARPRTQKARVERLAATTFETLLNAIETNGSERT